MKRYALPLLALLSLAACSKTPDDNTTPPDKPTPDPDPVVEETTVCTDAPILIETASTPVLGTSGTITVTKVSDGSQVDCIDLADIATVDIREDGQMIPKEKITGETLLNTFHDVLVSGGRYRVVHYTPLRVRNNGLEIRLHTGVLAFDTEYKVSLDAGVIEGGKATELTFKTGKKPASTSEITVSPDGKGDFCTVSGALQYVSTLSKSTAVTVSIAPGTYADMLYLRDKDNVTLKGTGKRTQSVIAYANCEHYEYGSGAGLSTKPVIGKAIDAKNTGGRVVFLAENCNNLTLENLTIRNTFGNPKGQAETLYFNSGNNTHKLTIENCELWSFQDTFLTKGVVWVHNSLIAGHCDYIWGYPKACLFEDCEIRSLDAGYIVQARINAASDKGFVFLNCSLTAAEGVANGKMYLARSGGDATKYDNVTFVGCKMAPVISPAGWFSNPLPNPSTPTASSGWKEYGSTDLTGNPVSHTSTYFKALTALEAQAFSSREAVLGY